MGLLKTDSGKKLLYETKSFIMTFFGVFMPLLLADPIVAEYINNLNLGIITIPSIDLLISFKLAASAAIGRSVVLFVANSFGVDYRKSTSEYKK